MYRIQSTLIALLIASGTAIAGSSINLTQGVSPISHDVYELHMLMFWVCVAIGVIVFGAMFYSILNHRRSKHPIPKRFHSHFTLEIAWTIVPVVILVILAIPATKVLFKMNDERASDMTIKITGYQWKWHYEYLEDGVSFFSDLSTPQVEMHNHAPKGQHYLREVDHPMVVPIHKKIRLLITSNDVNHAWWVPDLAVKRDAIGGFINEAWTIIDKPGVYYGQCAELCGVNHAFMPIVVIATTEEGYQDWVAHQKGEITQGDADTTRAWTLQELMTKGEGVYSHICVACHQPGGVGMPPTFPALKGSPIATGPISDHVNIVFNGKAGTAMQAFKGQLSDVELAGVLTYERNAFGNNTGTLVQPIQIQALRSGKTMEAALATEPLKESAKGASANTAPTKSAAGHEANPGSVKSTTSTTHAVPTIAASSGATTAEVAIPSAPVSPADSLKEAIARGETVYSNICAACHQPTGLGMPPTFPALKDSPITIGPVKDHLDRVLNGKPGTAMQAFKEQLTDQQLADVITYERNAFGNHTGILVTPEEVKAARGK
ncbi:MAG: cytochrome c oxidase subunit II [Gammaproteobacteria bacterium RIFCSPHIGHO2_12_FULL_42_10]|nr:MAG: cytochrome c oxidase subunit II [Gammaproteobacteria bacterium RIFCSPHIGHO2_12_FULL_42_10]